MTPFVLMICAGISWGGCGNNRTILFPDEESCRRSLREMRMDTPIQAESERRRSMYALCRPASPSEIIELAK